MKSFYLVLLMFMAFMLLAKGSFATAADVPLSKAVALNLTTVQRKTLDQIETYLNNIKTMQARFVQTTSQGERTKGTFYLSRPGRLRFEYDPPASFLILANETFLIYEDRELNQISHFPINSTPAGILVREHITLADAELTITQFERQLNTVTLTVTWSEESEIENIILVFDTSPIALRKWIITDAQGIDIQLELNKAQYGIMLADELFKFDDPRHKIPLY